MIRATICGRAAAAAAAATVTWPVAVTASPAAAPEPAPPSAAADVVLIGETPRTDELADLLIELLGGKGIEVRLTHKPVFRADDLLSLGDGRERSVSVFIEVPSDRVARLSFRGPRAARFLLRELGLRSGLDDVGREAVAQVVESSVSVMLSFPSQGMSRDEARAALARAPSPPPAPGTVVDLDPPPPTPPPRAPVAATATPPARATVAATPTSPTAARAAWHGWLAPRYSLAYAGAALGPAHGPGAEAALERERARLILRARLVVDRRFVQVIASRALDAEVRDEGARLLFELGWAPDTHRALSVGLGAGVDVSSIQPGAAHAADVTPAGGTTHLVPVARAELRYEIGGTGWRAAALVFADASLFETHYDLDRAGNLERLATPWPVRPGAAVVIGLRN